MVERRRHARHPFRVGVVLSWGGRDVAAHSDDVSFSGLSVQMDGPPPERQLVRLRIALPPHGEALAVMGMVARHLRPPAGPGGTGIQLFALGDRERERWTRFVRAVAAEARLASPAPVRAAAAGGRR